MAERATRQVDNRAVAEEIVQDAWLTVPRSLDRFERRSALRSGRASRLAGAERVRFEAHLAQCDACRQYLEQFRQTIRLLGRLPEESLSPEAREALLTAFRGLSRG